MKPDERDKYTLRLSKVKSKKFRIHLAKKEHKAQHILEQAVDEYLKTK